MREIEFRAWDTVNKKMITSPMAVCSGEGGWVIFTAECEGMDCSNAIHPIQQYELLQYTGLKDREGKEIYEGDIVYSHKYKFNLIVKWCDGKGENLGNQVGWWLDDDRYKVEFEAYLEVDEMQREEYANVSVLGNIYEHPELMKQ